MTLVYQVPMSATKTKNGNPDGSVQTLYNERMTDERSPTIKTPKLPWRPPTGYNRKVEEGNVQTYECTFQETYTSTTNTVYQVNGVGRSAASGYYSDPPRDVPSRLVSRAETIALNKLKKQSVNLAVAFAERKQTARLIESNLVKVARAARAVRRLDGREALLHLGLVGGKRRHSSRVRPEGVTDFWLELQYGWKPLLSDIYGSVENLNQVESEGSRLIATVTGTSKDTETWSKKLSDTLSGTSTVWDFTKYSQLKSRVKVRLDYVRTDEIPTDILTQLGLHNPLSVAWELVPFSFVVDWSFPLGEYFNLLDAAVGWKLKGGTCSRKAVLTSWPGNGKVRKRDPRYYKSSSGFVSVSGSSRQMLFNRVVYPESPIPHMPGFKSTASHMHVANGLALLSSAFLAPLGGRVR